MRVFCKRCLIQISVTVIAATPYWTAMYPYVTYSQYVMTLWWLCDDALRFFYRGRHHTQRSNCNACSKSDTLICENMQILHLFFQTYDWKCLPHKKLNFRALRTRYMGSSSERQIEATKNTYRPTVRRSLGPVTSAARMKKHRIATTRNTHKNRISHDYQCSNVTSWRHVTLCHYMTTKRHMAPRRHMTQLRFFTSWRYMTSWRHFKSYHHDVTKLRHVAVLRDAVTNEGGRERAQNSYCY